MVNFTSYVFVMLKNKIPVRGRKLHLLILLFESRNSAVEKQNPRKGTETQLVQAHIAARYPHVEKQNPRKGTETKES